MSEIPDLVDEETKTVSVATLATLLEIHERRIQQLVKGGYLPKPKKRGEYEMFPTIRAYMRYLKRGIGVPVEDAASASEGELLREQIRLTRAKAVWAELKAGKEGSNLIPAIDVEVALTEILGRLRARLLNFASDIAPQLLNLSTTNEIQTQVRRYVYEWLAEISSVKILGAPVGAPVPKKLDSKSVPGAATSNRSQSKRVG